MDMAKIQMTEKHPVSYWDGWMDMAKIQMTEKHPVTDWDES